MRGAAPHLTKLIEEQLAKQGGGAAPQKRRSKYGAKRTNGYDSAREARFAEALKLRRDAPFGDVAAFAEQVQIRFMCGASYVADFVVLLRDGSTVIYEVKGVETPEWKLKLKMLKHELPAWAARLEVVR